MRKQEQVTLGKGYTYKITQLPFRKSRSLLLKLTNLMGPALGEAVTATGDGEVIVDGGSIGAAIKTLAHDISDEDFEEIQNALVEHIVWINNEGDDMPLKPIVDEHFAGGKGLGRLFKLIGEALKVNYSDFLEGLGLAGLLQQSNPLVSRPTSTGTSGDS